jgi:CheY-like chemotaxis protein
MDRKLSVLLVEDEPLIAMTLVDLLDELGHETIEAGTAADALSAFRSRPDIDVLVTDIGLPDMQGDELARLCREIRPDLPVIFSTGHSMPAEEDADDPPTVHLAKPFQFEDLDRALRRLYQAG